MQGKQNMLIAKNCEERFEVSKYDFAEFEFLCSFT